MVIAMNSEIVDISEPKRGKPPMTNPRMIPRPTIMEKLCRIF
jgi:hypothetical protein